MCNSSGSDAGCGFEGDTRDGVGSGAIARGRQHPGRGPLRTAKERLGGKGSDEQDVDNRKVPPDLRGPKPGPERGGGVPGARPNFSHRDYSPLSCDVEDTQFGPSAEISAGCPRGR
jgi:hypothetical protein